MKIAQAFVILILGAVLLFGQTMSQGPAVAPGSCPVPPTIAGGAVTMCMTTDPVSPVYVAPNGSSVYQPMTTSATTAVTSFNGRTGAVKSPIGGATLQCTSITGTITIGASGAVTISNAVGTGCNL